MVSAAVDSNRGDHARISRRELARVDIGVPNGGDDNDVVVYRILNIGPKIGTVVATVCEAEDRRAMIGRPSDAADERVTSRRLRLNNRKYFCLRCDALCSPVRDDEARHSGAVSLQIRVWIYNQRRHAISRQHAASEVRMAGVDASIDHRDHDAIALAVPLGLVRVQVVEMPLSIPHCVGSEGWARDREGRR